ncbi:hypothetical protein Lal_00023510 [Lupinus albus]|uniref:Probable purine permease n=1 Tax=Lupinus albus TaxID=3870 RepID=A0A6A4NQG2_LUPAL|nr:putative purine permease, plant [Lupinus albus]KAF1860463.1 hypothetical protein Lal_00023510 [Lupinus albus]
MAEGIDAEKERAMKKILLIVNIIILAIGVCGGPLILRLYFIHGGNRVWLSSTLQTAGFPIILVPLTITYIIRRRNFSSATTTNDKKPKMINMKLPLFLASSFVGLLLGVDDYLYSYGVARLPVSTSALIIASQLAFTAIFAFFMVKQKFTAFSINAVFLLTLASGVLALHSSGDRPEGETSKEYLMGFIMTLLAAALYGFVLPLVELVYKKTKQEITFGVVLEIQFVMSLAATIFCVIGMSINHDFQAISREARNYELGEATYYVVLVVSAIIWQLGFLGSLGVIYCASSLLSGIMIAVSVPITEVLAIIFYKEKFKAEKGLSLVLAAWGFVSYFYGEYKQAKQIPIEPTPEPELTQIHSVLEP